MCAMLRNITTSKEDYLDQLLEVVSQMDKMERKMGVDGSIETLNHGH
jgi:hypothetical protein